MRSTGLAARLLSFVHCGSTVVGFTVVWMLFGLVALGCAVMVSALAAAMVWGMRIVGLWRPSYGSAVVSGVVAMAWLGLMVQFDLAGVLWVCVLIATTSPVRVLVQHLRRQATAAAVREGRTALPHGNALSWARPHGHAAPPATPPARPPAAPPVLREVEELDLDGLCLMWHRSYFQLLDPGPAGRTAAVVDYRQHILDEMDQRAPRGLQRWLASGPRPSGNPLPFLQSRAGCPDDEDTGGGRLP